MTVFWWHHVDKYRAKKGNRSELAPVRKSPRYHVNSPYLSTVELQCWVLCVNKYCRKAICQRYLISKLHGSEVLNCRDKRFLFSRLRSGWPVPRERKPKPQAPMVVEEKIDEKWAVRLRHVFVLTKKDDSSFRKFSKILTCRFAYYSSLCLRTSIRLHAHVTCEVCELN